jgi:general secretion pathway protein A
MNRPAILEFDLTSEAKRHVLLTGFRQGQPVLRFNDNITFPLAELLNYWNGYYLILWKAQASGIKTVFPGQTSDHVLWLRQQLTAFDGIDELTENPRFFDNTLKKRVINFQHHNNLSEDGKIGAQTMIYLDNQSGSENTPRLNTSD